MKAGRSSNRRAKSRLIRTSVPPHTVQKRGPVSQLEVVAACVNGDSTVLSFLIPYANEELRGLFKGTGTVMGFTEESIHASSVRVLNASQPDVPLDEPALTSSGFALGFMVAARLFGGVR